MTGVRMTPKMRRAVLGRGLLLQAAWNTQRMQSLGFSLAIEPWINRLHKSPQARAEALSRHQAYFNTNPYMAPFTIGMVCALEAEAAACEPAQREAKWRRIAALKVAAGGALAGIGDALFWGALRPACAAAAILAGAASWRLGLRQAPLVMAGAYLAAFNLPAQSARIRGLAMGYEWKDQIAVRMKALPWQAWIRRTRLYGAALAVALAAFAAAWTPGRLRLAGLAGFGIYLGAARLGGPALSPARFYAACCAAGSLAAAAGWF